MDKKLSVNDFDLLNSGLVFTKSENENEEVYTTDIAISNAAGFSKEYVDRKIRTHENRLLKFGVYGIEFRKPTSKNGGRPLKIIKLNRKQAIALCNTFDDSPQILDFKFKLADAFIDAIDLLSNRRIEHHSMKKTIKTLDEVIHDSSNFNSKWDYGNVKKLIYQKVLGMSLSAYQRVHNIPTNKTRLEFMSEQQLSDWNNVAELVIVYIKLGYDYEQLKSVINGISLKVKISG